MSNAALKIIPDQPLTMGDVISALSYALDLTEGQPRGHCLRSCYIGMNIGRALGLPSGELHDLYYTLLLKDSGCSSNAARLCQLYGQDDIQFKHDYKTVDSQSFKDIAQFVLSHTKTSGPLKETFKRYANIAIHGENLANEVTTTRCERGADIARELGFSDAVAAGVRSLDEHWNGKGRPLNLMGKMIPLFSRIALMSQVIDVFHTMYDDTRACEEIANRKGTWFDPYLCDLFLKEVASEQLWKDLKNADVHATMSLCGLRPQDKELYLSDEQLDRIANAFAKIVDAKSSYTAGHSTRVAIYSEVVAQQLGLPHQQVQWIKRGALLHDIGKLTVSNCILDKPGKLTDEEWVAMRLHPKFTEEILQQIGPFQELARIAGAHHERLDGKGYPYGISAKDISLETRIITVADVYDALSADRPYRGPMPPKQAIEIMQRDRDRAFDGKVLDALIECLKGQY